MPRPKPDNKTSSAPQRHAAVLRTEGNRMNSEGARLQAEAKLLLQAADLLDKDPEPKPVQYAVKQAVAA